MTSVPRITVQTFPNQKPWVNGEVRAKLKAWTDAYSSGDLEEYRKSRYALRRAISSAKRQYRDKVESHYKGSNTRSMWAGLKTLTDYKKKISSAEAPGPDGIPGRALKVCADQLADVFADIFNMSLLQSVVPTCFKETIIVPVPKKTKILSLNDDRPVALTSTIIKCFERLVKSFITSRTHWTHFSLPTGPTGQTPGCADGQHLILHPDSEHWRPPGLCAAQPSAVYSLFTHDCVATHSSNTIIKFADDDTTVIGLITGDERDGLQRGGGRERNTPPSPSTGLQVERVSSFRFLGVHISEDLTWTHHTDFITKSARQQALLPPQAAEAQHGLMDLLCSFYRWLELLYLGWVMKVMKPLLIGSGGAVDREPNDSMSCASRQDLRSSSSLSRDDQTSLTPDTSSSSSGGTPEEDPGHAGETMSLSWPGNALGGHAWNTSLGRRPGGIRNRCPSQPQLTPLDVKEQRLYSELLPSD
ncbi:hypothetical protein L3Q82_015515 [Scortum barcoo]|uniref:Uncharacterized protein n=1 Tax=Scortum barcoo TaxID=214431 RepID=A0ACB8VRM8_9TELE|nr:hypothetical protein L3Q82_015515 [Scortum barcoo]